MQTISFETDPVPISATPASSEGCLGLPILIDLDDSDRALSLTHWLIRQRFPVTWPLPRHHIPDTPPSTDTCEQLVIRDRLPLGRSVAESLKRLRETYPHSRFLFLLSAEAPIHIYGGLIDQRSAILTTPYTKSDLLAALVELTDDRSGNQLAIHHY